MDSLRSARSSGESMPPSRRYRAQVPPAFVGLLQDVGDPGDEFLV